MEMKIFVVGGAGYIGSHVVRALLDRGDEVMVYDNLSSGALINLYPEGNFIQGDILDFQQLTRALSDDYDAVIHLAALKAAGESMEMPEKYAENNLSGTINLLNACCNAGVTRLIFSSSAAVYGEPEYLPIDEKHPTRPANFYGFTKLEIERLLAWYDSLKNLRYAALRYFNAAGYDPKGRVRGLERNPANLIPVIMETAANMREKLSIFGDDYPTEDGTGVRDYIHVTDLAIAHVQALDYISKKDKSLTVNLGSEHGLSVYQILETAREVTGQPIPAEVVSRRAGDPAKLVASSHMASQLLDWHAQYSDVQTLIKTSWDVYKLMNV
jgi:UDP-glucose 4-epimerase